MYFFASSFYIENEEVALQKVDETLKKEIMDLLIASRINNGKDGYVNPDILKK